MRDHAILMRDRHPQGAPEIAVVPYGFSWGAFLFQALWALYRGVWLTAIVLLVAGSAVSLLAGLLGLDPLAGLAVQVAGALVLGLAANDMRRFELVRRGYRLCAIVAAASLAEAEARGIRSLVEEAGEQPGGAREISHSQGLQPLAKGSM